MESAETTSTSLIRRAKAGDADAWNRIVEIYGPAVYRWLRQKGLQPSDASDVMQNVFRNVVRSLQNFQKTGPDDSFRGWLFVITRNEHLQFYRQQKGAPPAAGGTTAHMLLQDAPDDVEEWTASISLSDESRIVRRALELIRPDFEEVTWTAFWRMTIDGHAAGDIGDDLGMSAKAVRQAKYRVLLKLRQLLDDDLGDALG